MQYSGSISDNVFRHSSSQQKKNNFQDEGSLGCRTVDLRTSTIKIDAEQSDLRFCFRIISPMKTYTLQVCYKIGRIDDANFFYNRESCRLLLTYNSFAEYWSFV